MPSHPLQVALITVVGIVLFVTLQRKTRPFVLLTNVKPILTGLTIGGCVGILWAASLGQRYLYWQQLEGEIQQDVTIEGRIAGISNNTRSSRLILEQVRIGGKAWPSELKAVIYYYEPDKHFIVSQQISAKVRLKPARAVANPAGFDTQKWYVSQQIVRTGYVIGQQVALVRPSLTLRSQLQQTLSALQVTGDKWLQALMFGDRRGFTDEDWTLLKATGTAHLFAISGLHLALAGGVMLICVQCVSVLCRASRFRFTSLLPVQWACMLLGSTAYAYCANWQVSVTRAYVVLCVWICLWSWSRRLGHSNVLLLTATICLVIQPEAVYGMALYLSLGAVAIIMLIHWRWRSCFRAEVPWWRKLLIMQGLMSVGLIPMTLVMFQSVSWVAPVFNLLLIPLMSLAIVPACLVGLLLLLCCDADSVLLRTYLNLVGSCLDRILQFMKWGALRIEDGVGTALLSGSQSVLLAITVVILGVLMLPFIGKHRLMLVILFVCLYPKFLPGFAKKPELIHYFDVGQGSASMVTRYGRAVIIDTGASFSDTGSYAESVLLPFIQQHGLTVDLLIISHGDNDHAGGLEVLKRTFPELTMLSPDNGCESGMQWMWQGLQFETFWPLANSDITDSDNNRSCVVKVSGQYHSALFPGDIEASAEQTLITQLNRQTELGLLNADVLLAPHHGSATSSTEAFINAVSPRYAIFSQGWLNRWGFPNPQVVDRYQRRNVTTINTSKTGYLRVDMGKSLTIQQYRQIGPWYHHAF
ncbi:competence protein ComEC [Marisediminitalea aggregata]|uniref:Competence protein ComEC n=1 Tax=Marisediminitalea aggregata TaxID=634436 RepID=A0A1M5IYI9_9ALTE|nr:DNA internalization-related competence protein ComEC/Rec2 [Marisediminitalea aggregata]SHG33109.1 competence protein ComEC [Marisediminitalea aggregata]